MVAEKLCPTYLEIFFYFVACTVALVAILEAYAWLLRRAALLPRPFPLLLGLFLYVVVACAFALPLFGIQVAQGARTAVGDAARWVEILGYLVSLWVPVLFFRRRHVDALKALGYFQPRR